MIQFTISSDPVGSEVMPEGEVLEIDSKKEAGGLTGSGELRETVVPMFLNLFSLQFGHMIFNYVGYEVLTAVVMNVAIIGDIGP
jgi:hypothetical protein